MYPYRTETVDTPAGKYVIELHQDSGPSNPLTDYDNSEFMFLIEYSGYGMRWDTDIDTLANNAGSVVRELLDRYGHDPEQVGRRYLKWAAIAGNSWILAMGGRSASQSEYYRYVVLADSNQLPDVNQAIKDVMSDYQTYASGGVSGYVTKAPNGEIVESVWGFYSDDDALAEGRALAIAHASERCTQAGRAGAGFIGIL